MNVKSSEECVCVWCVCKKNGNFVGCSLKKQKQPTIRSLMRISVNKTVWKRKSSNEGIALSVSARERYTRAKKGKSMQTNTQSKKKNKIAKQASVNCGILTCDECVKAPNLTGYRQFNHIFFLLSAISCGAHTHYPTERER